MEIEPIPEPFRNIKWLNPQGAQIPAGTEILAAVCLLNDQVNSDESKGARYHFFVLEMKSTGNGVVPFCDGDEWSFPLDAIEMFVILREWKPPKSL